MYIHVQIKNVENALLMPVLNVLPKASINRVLCRRGATDDSLSHVLSTVPPAPLPHPTHSNVLKLRAAGGAHMQSVASCIAS